MKRCGKCKQHVSLDGFCKDRKSKDSLANTCKACRKIYREQNKLKIQLYQLDWYEKNQDKVRSYNEKYKAKHKDRITENRILRLYKMTVLQYNEMLSSGCHVCGSFSNLCIDHDHACCPGELTCGKCIRGVLCNKCNSAEGLLDSDLQKVLNLYSYLKASLKGE